MDNKILCSSTTTSDALYPVVKVWLKKHNIQYEERAHSAGSHYWKVMLYKLTPEELIELIAYLREAEVLNKSSEIII